MIMDISRMQEKAPGHFHKGFYLTENIISSFWAIENEYTEGMSYEDSEIVDRLFPDAEVFLRGSCGLFALALHDEFGYAVYEAKDGAGRLLHIFCKATYKCQDAYIDIRGITTSFLECFSEFDEDALGLKLVSPKCNIMERDIEQDRQLENEGDAIGLRFARDIVKKYRSYYDISF